LISARRSSPFNDCDCAVTVLLLGVSPPLPALRYKNGCGQDIRAVLFSRRDNGRRLCIRKSGRLERKREAALDRLPPGVAGQPHRHGTRGLLAKVGNGAGSICAVELALGVGDRAQHPAFAIFTSGGKIDFGTGDLDVGQGHFQRLRSAVPAHVAGPQLRQVELVADVAGKDQRPLGANQPAEPLLPARSDGHIARDERHQPVLRAHRLQR
jgi:hypothetical protein